MLASESLKPGKLKRHLQTEHDSYPNRLEEFFHRLLQTWEKQRQSYESEFIDEGKYTSASFEASLLIAKSKKPYNFRELILPAAIKIRAILFTAKKRQMKCEKLHCQTILCVA